MSGNQQRHKRGHYKTVKVGDYQHMPKWYLNVDHCIKLMMANDVELHPLEPLLQANTPSFVCHECKTRYYAQVMVYVYVKGDHTRAPIETCLFCAAHNVSSKVPFHDITVKLLGMRHQG